MAHQNSSEEVDLRYLLKKSNDFFKGLARAFVQVLYFVKRYIYILIILILVGFAYGYYKDYNSVNTYDNEIIVIPNFESVDYLYSKVKAINLKIAQNDTIHLQQIFGNNFDRINGIEIEPIVDIYNFVSKSYRNYDVLRLIAEKQDFSKYVEDLSTSKYYKYHRMIISVNGNDSSDKIVNNMLEFLNSNEHFNDYKAIYRENNKLDIEEHYIMIAQIDSLLKANYNLNAISANVSINNGTDLFNLIDRKKQLVKDLVQLRMETIDYSVPIKKVSANYNLKPEKFIQLSNKIKFPLLLVSLFSLVFLFIYLFKKLKGYADTP